MKWWLLALALAGCGASARPARPGSLVARRPPHEPSSAWCQGLPGHSGGTCAIATLDAEAGSVEVLLRIAPEALPAGRTQVEVRGGGEVRARERDVTEVRYTVALDGAPAPGASFRHPAGWHLAGSSFAPEILVDGVAVDVAATLLLDVGEAPVLSSAGPGARVFEAASFARLAEESFEVGPIALGRREVEGTTLWVGGTGRGDGELEVAADALGEAYRALVHALGEGPSDSLLVVLHRPEAEPWGERRGTSLVYAVPPSEDPEAALADALRPMVELFLTTEDPWIGDGVVTYLATRVAIERLELDDGALSRQMLRAAATEEDRGVLAAFCLDGYLAERRSSLAATLARARGAPLTTDAILSDLAAISSGAASYLAALLEPGAELSVDECLERQGWRAEPAELEGPTDSALRDALAVASWHPLEGVPALRVGTTAPGGPLQRGDHLLGVGAHRVGSPDDVAWALRELAAGSEVVLDVRRRGERVSIDWTVPDLATVERAARPHVALARVEAATP